VRSFAFENQGCKYDVSCSSNGRASIFHAAAVVLHTPQVDSWTDIDVLEARAPVK